MSKTLEKAKVLVKILRRFGKIITKIVAIQIITQDKNSRLFISLLL
jgi:hypothetical protein